MSSGVSDIVAEELAILQTEIIYRHEQAGQVATGKTKRSFESFTIADAQGYKGILQGAPYVGALERHRGPAKNTSKGASDFVANLKEWIIARKIPVKDEKDLHRLARFFAWYINKFGSKGYREGRQTDILTTPIANFESRLTQRIANYFNTQVQNDAFNI